MDNQTTVQAQNVQETGQNSVSQAPLAPEKPSINFLAIGLTVLISAVVFGFGGYYVGNKQASNTQPVPSATSEANVAEVSPSPISDATSNWKSFTTKDGKFSIKYPPDWTLADQSKEVDLYNDGNIQLSQDISISKNSHVFRSRNPLAWGPGVCIFPDSPPFEGPSQEFKDFIEVKTNSFTFRRPKTTQTTTTNDLRWTICAKEATPPGNFTNVAGFGTAWYETPISYDEKLLKVMDQIFSSFKSLN